MIVNKYSDSIIYSIRCNTTGKQYIGSTIQGLKQRIGKHEGDFRGHYGYGNMKPRAWRSSFDVLENDNYEIYKVEDYPCDSSESLEIREAQHILKGRAEGFTITNKNLPKSKILKKIPFDLSSLPALS